MFRTLSIENFKVFGQQVEVPLAPITLVYGPNASGKSTILQALLLLKQSLESEDPETPALLMNGLVDLGNFPGVVHRHDLHSNVGVGFELSPEGSRRGRTLGGARLKGAARIDLTFGWNPGERTVEQREVQVSFENLAARFHVRTLERSDTESKAEFPRRTLHEFLFADDQSVDSARSWLNHRLSSNPRVSDTVARPVGPEDDDLYRALVSKTARSTFRGGGYLPISPHLRRQARGVTGEDYAAFSMSRGLRAWQVHFSDLESAMRASFEEMAYLGPLRDPPHRFHIFSGASRSNVGRSGEYTVEVLARRPELLARVNSWLERLEIPYSISISEFSTEQVGETVGDLIALVLRDRRSGVSVSASDVGFGISQLLPIVVQCLLHRRSTILIEQPEIHVHPRLQAELAELVADSAGAFNQNQLIIETHSETLVLRLQRLIRRGDLSSDRVSVLYVDTMSDGFAYVRQLTLGDSGEFLVDWPKGFFEERVNEMLDLPAD